MDDFYGAEHRALQDRHGMRRVADRLQEMAHTEFAPDEKDFVESRTMVFVSSVDETGRPTVSYKGGAPGFIRVTGDHRVEFPSYDGNGMFLTLGNIAATAAVGLLFIDFERPRRLRLQGSASISTEAADLAAFPGAQYLVRVTPERIIVNCGRYIHAPGTVSRHVPDASGRQPFPNWKRIDVFGDVLPEDDRAGVAAAGGPIGLDRYEGE